MIKRTLLSGLLIAAVWLACPLSGTIRTGSQVSSLLSTPAVGLDTLSNYKTTLNITFQGTQSGQSLSMTTAYVQTEWSQQKAKFTFIDTTDASGQHQTLLFGAVGDAQYFQADSSSSCGVNWGPLAGGPSDFSLASLLPEIGNATLTGEATVNGIASRHYTFDAASLGLPADATANGEAWLAKDGGYLVKYLLDITGSDSLFGAGVQGTRHMEYELSEVGAQTDVVYPAGCEPVLTDVPAMDNASDLTRLPGLLTFSTTSSADAVFSFYQDKLNALGWQKVTEVGKGTDSAVVTYTRSDPGGVAFVEVDRDTGSSSNTVLVSLPQTVAASATSPAVTPGAEATRIASSPALVITKSVALLIGSDSKPSALPSYHLDAQLLTPVWAGGKIAQDQETMTADVQDKNVHFIDRTNKADGSNQNAEAYLMGSQDYDVVNGKVQSAGVSMSVLDWKLWPFNLTMILATGATGATDSGPQTLDGRRAEVYTLDVSGATAPTVAGVGLAVTSVTGKVWVDVQTDALLKADLDYQADVKDSSGADQGSGGGHLALTVTQVGLVTVSLPAH